MKTKYTNNNFKKSVILLAITAALSTSAMATESTATENSAAEEIDIITVTATRSSLNIDDALTSQVVITRADIELVNPTSVLDLLSTLPSVDIANNGGRGQTASIFMRGTNSGHTLVLIDGIRVSSATTGSTSFSNISPEMIERIEIVQGPRAALWGSDAIGGVIQIFTRQLEDGEHFVGVSLGSEEYRKYKAGIGLSHGDGQTTVSVSHERAEGFDVRDVTRFSSEADSDDDGYEFTSISIRGQQKVNKALSLDWLFSSDDGETESDGFYTGANTKNHAWLVRANYASKINDVKNNTVFSVGQNRDSSDSLASGVSQGIFETRRDQFSLVNNSQFSNNFQVNAGIDFYQDDVSKSTTVYGDDKRDITGAFVHGLYTDDTLTFEGTVRHDSVSGVDSENTYNLGTGIKINEDSRVVLNYGTGFKVPTFNSLYFPGSDNPELTSELSETIELFLETTIADINTNINIYHSTIDDLIEWTGSKSENINSVKIDGIEFSADYIGLGGKHDFNMSYTDAEDQSTGQQLTRRAKEKANYKFSTTLANAAVYAEYKFVGSRQDRGNVDLDAYQLLNLGLNTPLSKNLILNARVTNLLDKEYQTINTYFTQGRALYIGVTYQNF